MTQERRIGTPAQIITEPSPDGWVSETAVATRMSTDGSYEVPSGWGGGGGHQPPSSIRVEIESNKSDRPPLTRHEGSTGGKKTEF